MTALPAAAIAALEGVSSVRRDGSASEIMTSDAEHVVRQLLLRDAGLSGLEMSGAGLEEAFLTLTSTQAARLANHDERTMGGSRDPRPRCDSVLRAGPRPRYLVGPNSAPPIVNLIYLPMSFLSGLWIPFEILPPVVKTIAPFLPAFHLGQLALGAIGAGAGTPAWSHVAALGGFTPIGLGLAFWGYRRDEDRTWG